MSKQTAVEWLEQEIKKLNIKVNGAIQVSAIRILEQALQMEKQQIIDAFGTGCHHESKRLVGYHDIAEQYYNKTFKTKQK